MDVASMPPHLAIMQQSWLDVNFIRVPKEIRCCPKNVKKNIMMKKSEEPVVEWETSFHNSA